MDGSARVWGNVCGVPRHYQASPDSEKNRSQLQFNAGTYENRRDRVEIQNRL